MGCLEAVSPRNEAVAYLALVAVTRVSSQCTLATYTWFASLRPSWFGVWFIGFCIKLGLPFFSSLLVASLLAQGLLLHPF